MVVRAARCLGRRAWHLRRGITSSSVARGVARGVMKPTVLIALSAGSSGGVTAYRTPILPQVAIEELVGEEDEEEEPR